MEEKIIKSKQRKVDFGEVNTNTDIVSKMIDLVNIEFEKLDSKFLEPACGDGNFLCEVLNRKMEFIKSKHANQQIDYEKFSIQACSSIYGIELLDDNVQSAKDYQIIYNDIEEQLNQEFNERDNAIRFINKIKIKRNNIILYSPDINTKSWKKLKNNIEKGELVRMEHSDFFFKMFNDKNDKNDKNDITLDNLKKKLQFHSTELLII